LSDAAFCFLYVVQCRDNTLYTGISSDVKRRILLHNTGKGAAYTAARCPVDLLAIWQFDSRSAALKAEFAFKKLTRQTKLQFIMQRKSFRDAPFLIPD
jgi:putative endonuclease